MKYAVVKIDGTLMIPAEDVGVLVRAKVVTEKGWTTGIYEEDATKKIEMVFVDDTSVAGLTEEGDQILNDELKKDIEKKGKEVDEAKRDLKRATEFNKYCQEALARAIKDDELKLLIKGQVQHWYSNFDLDKAELDRKAGQEEGEDYSAAFRGRRVPEERNSGTLGRPEGRKETVHALTIHNQRGDYK